MKLHKFLKSRAGRKFYNFAYCWGACLVILGAVFKIAHMPFDSVLLMIGLFTEVFIFFISGFDTPDDVYEWEKVFPELRKDEKTGTDLSGTLEAARQKYLEGANELQGKMNDLSKAYTEQADKIRKMSASVSPEALDRMENEVTEMTRLLHELNSRYGRVLESMGPEKKS